MNKENKTLLSIGILTILGLLCILLVDYLPWPLPMLFVSFWGAALYLTISLWLSSEKKIEVSTLINTSCKIKQEGSTICCLVDKTKCLKNKNIGVFTKKCIRHLYTGKTYYAIEAI